VEKPEHSIYGALFIFKALCKCEMVAKFLTAATCPTFKAVYRRHKN